MMIESSRLSLPPPKNRLQQGGSNCKVSQQGGATTTPPDKGGATATPPNDRGKKEKRGEDDDKRRWWEEGCDGVAMDTIVNQLGAAERRWTRDNDGDYNRDYVDNRGKNDADANRWGGSFEMAAGEGTTMIATATTATSRMEAGDGSGGEEGVEEKEEGGGVGVRGKGAGESLNNQVFAVVRQLGLDVG